MSQALRPFNIMAKPVSGVCNLACRYCYYRDKPAELYPGVEKFQMSQDVLAAFVAQYTSAMPARVEFNWQGGEPLLAGLDFYRRAVALQAEHRRDGQEVTNALQTNGTLLDEEWCEFLARQKFLVGLSLDGPAQWHDAFRRDHVGEGTFAKAWAGLKRLEQAGAECNVLVTINSSNGPHGGDIYRYFVNRGIRYVQFIPILERDADGRPTDFSCRPEQLARLLLEVFEQWAATDAGRISERFIDNVIHTILFGQASTCCYADKCANAFVLEFNGDLYACDHFVYPQWRIGNIMDRPLRELLADEKLAEFARLKTDLPAACRDCEYLPYCNGGCPKHHMPIGTDPGRVNYFCDAYKEFFRQALPTLKEMAEYFRRGERPPPRSPTDGRRPAAVPTPGAPGRVGRNDPCPCGSGRKFKNCCGRS